MPRFRTLQSNFTAGELSPRMFARADVQRYYNGAAIIENGICNAVGGIEGRAGLIWAGDPTIPAAPAAVLGFVRNVADAVAIIVHRNTLRFFDAATRLPILSGGLPYEIACPWTDADLQFLTTWQSVDVLYIADRRGTAPVRTLKRLAATNWVLAALDLREGPWAPDVEGATLTASAVTGSGISLNASAAAFVAAHVGALVQVRQNAGNPPVLRWETGKPVALNDLRANAGRVYRATAAGTTGTSPPIHDRGTVSDGAIAWAFVHDGAGVARITAFVSATQVTADVVSELPTLGPTSFWALSLWNGASGYPTTGAIYQERFALAGAAGAPDTLVAGRTGGYGPDFADFKRGLGTGLVVDSDAVQRELANGRAEPMTDLLARERLYAFTPGGVHVIGGPSIDEPITPSAASARRRTGFGAEPGVAPLETGDSILYVTRGGRGLRDVGRDGDTQSLTLVADHIARRRFAQLVCQDAPDGTIWTRLRDGGLAALTYEPAEQVTAFSRAPIGGGGRILSMARLPRADGRDEIWMIVARTIAGATRHAIEILTPPWDEGQTPVELACCLDGAGFVDAWNASATTMRLLVLSADDRRGAVEASAATFTSADVGRTFALRLAQPAAGYFPGAASAIARVRVDTFVSATRVEGRIVSSGPAALAGTATTIWARMASTFGGLARLEGQTVTAYADGEVFTGLTVTGGQVTLPEPVARGWIGLPFFVDIVDMPVAAGLAETGLAADKRVDKVEVIALAPTPGLTVSAPGSDQFDPLVWRRVDDEISTPTPGFQGYAATVGPGGWNAAGQVRLRHTAPTPISILGIVKTVVVG